MRVVLSSVAVLLTRDTPWPFLSPQFSSQADADTIEALRPAVAVSWAPLPPAAVALPASDAVMPPALSLDGVPRGEPAAGQDEAPDGTAAAAVCAPTPLLDSSGLAVRPTCDAGGRVCNTDSHG